MLLSALQAAGGLFVPLLHTLPVKEMAYVVRKSGAERLIVCDSLADKGADLAAETGSVWRSASSWRGDKSYSDLLSFGSPTTSDRDSTSVVPLALELATSADDPLPTISSNPFDTDRQAFMLFTSGSTGNPKGVPMRHSALASYVLALCDSSSCA
jgi:D-alanine--poly(phosphoribitol) ligase subunit 1